MAHLRMRCNTSYGKLQHISSQLFIDSRLFAYLKKVGQQFFPIPRLGLASFITVPVGKNPVRRTGKFPV